MISAREINEVPLAMVKFGQLMNKKILAATDNCIIE